MSLSLQIISDLHLEFQKKWKVFRPRAPFLCLLGDVFPCGSVSYFNQFAEWMEEISKQYLYVFHVLGNHEYYCFDSVSPMSVVETRFKQLGKKIKNYIPMIDRAITLAYKGSRYKLIGTTLWCSPEDQAKNLLNDYVRIFIGRKKNITPRHVCKLCSSSIGFICKELRKAALDPTLKCIILTHHKPILTANRKSDDHVINSNYENNFAKQVLYSDANVALVAYGHTHKAIREKKDKTMIVSNPFGYPYERTGYKEEVFIV